MGLDVYVLDFELMILQILTFSEERAVIRMIMYALNNIFSKNEFSQIVFSYLFSP